MDNNLEFKVSPEYQEHRLFGYLVDHERRLIVNLVNTAWYSLGGRFNNILADLEADPTNWNIYHVETGNKAENPTVGDILRKHTAARLKRVLNKKEYISEYNSQITGINLFELSDMQTTQKEYSEYFVITCLHHPFNWLKWDEQYAFDDKGDDTNAKRLSKLIGLSNLILTGHEHVPKQVKGEMKSNSCVMLKSGCFLFDNQHSDEGNLENGWFSVLHIDSDRATVRQDKHYYVVKEHSGNWDDLKSDRSKTGYYKLRKKNAGYPDKGERLQEISKMVNNTSVEQLFALLNTLFEADERAINVELISSIPEAKFFRVERTGLANLTEICIIVRTENAYDVLRKESFCEQLISLAADVRAKVSIFRFVILDLFIDPPDLSRMAPHLQEKYSFKERSSQLQLKTLIADDMFDIMRYEMFVNFEKRFASSGNLPSEFELIRDAMFVNTIVPFWVAENIWRSAKIRV